MRMILVAAVVLVALFSMPEAVNAQALCAPREIVVEQLAGKYGEAVRHRGFDQRGMVVEVFVFEETGTWTFLFTRPDGISCIAAAGDAWENVDPAPAGDGV